MKHILLTGLLLMAFGQVSVDAQTKKRAQDDIYYTAEDAKRDAEAAEKERLVIEEARNKRAAEREVADPGNTTDRSSNSGGYNGNSDEYIDYDDDEYFYSNRFNRFNSPYYGNSYWAYDPFWGPGMGYGMGMGWGYGGWGMSPGWGMSVGYGPYWSSCWGWNSWYGYPGFYSAWNSPYMGWGYGNWGYGGGYYNGFYDGYYAGAYNNGGGNFRSTTYGPRSSMNRYPGSARETAGRASGGQTGGNRGQLKGGNEPVQGRQTRNNYPDRFSERTSGSGSMERRGNVNPNESRSYSNTERANPGTYTAPSRAAEPQGGERYNRSGRGTQAPAREYNSSPAREYNTAPAQQAQPSYQRSEPTYQRAEPAPQRSEPSYQRSEPARNYSAPSSPSPSRSSGGGGFSGGSRGGGRGR